MSPLPFTPALLLANSVFSSANRLVDALFDSTFTDIYKLQPFDYAILVPYFAVLIVLSAILTHSASGLRRAPWQASQGAEL